MFKRISAKIDPTLTRVTCQVEQTPGKDFVFWIPTASLNEHGHVPGNIIRARIKHAFGVNQGHYSYSTELL